MRSKVLVTLSGILIWALIPRDGVAQERERPVEHVEDHVKLVSMVELLARPMDFEGALIEVSGFYSYDGLSAALFLTRDLAKINDLDSAFLISMDESIENQCSGHYATIEGRFKRRLPGTDPENFMIVDVTQVWIFDGSDPIACWPPEADQPSAVPKSGR